MPISWFSFRKLLSHCCFTKYERRSWVHDNMDITCEAETIESELWEDKTRYVIVYNVALYTSNWSWKYRQFRIFWLVFGIFKPPLPVGAGGGDMFSGRPSVPLSVRASVIHMVVLCFRDISSICWRIFAKLLSLVHLGTQMTWLRFGVKRSKFKVIPSRRRRTAQHSTLPHSKLPSSVTFSSYCSVFVMPMSISVSLLPTHH